MSKTLEGKLTYKKEQQPRTRKRKVEEERATEVELPSRPQLARIKPKELDSHDDKL